MASRKVPLTPNVWAEVTAVDASIQNRTTASVYFVQSASEPTSPASNEDLDRSKLVEGKKFLVVVDLDEAETVYAYTTKPDAYLSVD